MILSFAFLKVGRSEFDWYVVKDSRFNSLLATSALPLNKSSPQLGELSRQREVTLHVTS